MNSCEEYIEQAIVCCVGRVNVKMIRDGYGIHRVWNMSCADAARKLSSAKAACRSIIRSSHRVSPSSRGPGRGPFKAKTRVRIPLGTPAFALVSGEGCPAEALRAKAGCPNQYRASAGQASELTISSEDGLMLSARALMLGKPANPLSARLSTSQSVQPDTADTARNVQRSRTKALLLPRILRLRCPV